MANTYHVLNFDDLNPKGLKPLMNALKKAGGDIVKLEPAGPARRKDGVQMKTFGLINVDGQEIAINVTETGDISGATLNGKNYPALAPQNITDMAQRIVAAFNANAAAYANALARKLVRAANQDTDRATRAGVKSVAQRVKETREKVGTLHGNIDLLNQTITEQQQRINAAQTTASNASSTITTETAKQRALRAEIKQLKDAIYEYSN